MSILSKSAEYALRASIYVVAASQNGHKCGLKEIAAAIDSPLFFTAKILQELTRKKLIQSSKGPHGGFYVETDGPDITMLSLVEAIDGCDQFTACALGLKHCSEENPCPIHNQYQPIRAQIMAMLKNTTIQELAHRALTENQQNSVYSIFRKRVALVS